VTAGGELRPTLVLTGASRGIGHATVKRFSDAGWRILTCSREDVPEACKRDPNWTHHIPTDLSDPASLERFVDQAGAIIGAAPLHALVNNAAISPKGPDGTRLDSLSTPMADWHQVFGVNFFAPIRLARGLIEELKKGPGTIVNVTSIAGGRVHPFAGTAYATSKAALASLTREMAYDFGRLGIRVNAIAPGEIRTAILSPDTEAQMLPEIPMGRLGTPEEVAKTIYFLCSDQSSYVNGAEIHINGGQHV